MSRRTVKSPGKIEPIQKPAPRLRPQTALIVSILAVLIIGGIPFGLGRYIEVKSPDPFDSSAYVYSAKHLLNGARLGADEVTSAFPDTLLVNIIGVKLFGFNDVGPKVVQMVLQVAALVFLFYTLYRFFGSAAAVVSTVMAAVYLSAPLIAKGGNVKEQFMIAFMLSAACAFMHYEFGGKRLWLLPCGFLAIQPYYFKPTGFSILIVLGGYLLVSRLAAKSLKKLFVESALLVAGVTAGLLVPASLYIWQEQFSRFLRTFPILVVKTLVTLLVIAAAIYYAVILWRRFDLWRRLKSVNRRIYKIGAIALVGALIVATIIVAWANIHAAKKYTHATATVGQDVVNYFWTMPLTGVPLKLGGRAIGQVYKLIGAAGLRGGYVENSWKLVQFSDIADKILRYYKALSAPIVLAALSILTAAFVTIHRLRKKQPLLTHDRFVWLLAAWWGLDMAFVWVSPHSYEQYYLPLCASAAVLGAYAAWRWQQALSAASFKLPWLAGAAAAAVILMSLSIPIFIGQRYSPDTGLDYTANGGPRRRGFAEALNRVKADQKAPWEQAGEYIRAHSSADDTIYVWGWFPGIYVEAGRMAPVAKAYEADMHFMSPEHLRGQADLLVSGFEKHPPKFIVDSRKRHFPFNRPPLELWPVVPPKMLGNEQAKLLDIANPQEVELYNTAYRKFLNDRVDPDEARRFDAMAPLREYVMQNYRFAGQYGEHMVFERKPAPGK